MRMSTSKIARGVVCLATASLALTGVSLAAATPAIAAPAAGSAFSAAAASATVTVNVGDIAPTEAAYLGWHEGYDNATPAYSIKTDGLHLGNGAPSQILNGLVAAHAAGVETTDLLSLIMAASVDVKSGPVTFQVAVTWGTTGWATLRSAALGSGTATFTANDQWTSSKPIGAISADTPTALDDLIGEMEAAGNVRYSGFGIQADTAAVANNISWNGTTYDFAVEPSRIAGASRFDTAIEISESFAPGVRRVYVASGMNYPDALSAGPAAGHSGGPLLLTLPDELPAAVAAELTRLDAGEIVLVGGMDAVSEKVATSLAKITTVKRISGADRYETSRAIAADAFGADKAATAYIATGNDFPDALSASPAAAHLGGPVVLVPGWTTKIDAPSTKLLADLEVTEVKIAGGTAVVSAAFEASLATEFGATHVKRHAGIDRYATGAAINSDAFVASTTAYLATGAGFADALSGAALAGFNDSPLFVTDAHCIPRGTLDGIAKLAAANVVLIGGTAVLNADIEALKSCG
jgi:putative cell wall-binding protein